MDKKELFELSDNVYRIRQKISDMDSLIESKKKSITKKTKETK